MASASTDDQSRPPTGKLSRVRRRVRPKMTIKQILAWADAHHRRTGRWPTYKSGLIVGASGPVRGADTESWSALNAALVFGCRGLPGGDSLVGLLARRRWT